MSAIALWWDFCFVPPPRPSKREASFLERCPVCSLKDSDGFIYVL